MPDDPQTWEEAIRQLIDHNANGEGALARYPRRPRPGETSPVYWQVDALTSGDRAFNIDLLLRGRAAVFRHTRGAASLPRSGPTRSSNGG
jgi:hypothetical protein